MAKSITLKPAATGVVVADAIKLVSTSPVDNRSFTYNYDANGQQTEVRDNNPNAATDTFKVTTDGLARTTQVQELKTGVERAKTDYTYDLDSNVLSTNAQRGADANTLGVSRYTGYTWDVRNLVDTVKAGATSTSTDTWSYTYDGRGLRSTVTKPNGNLATYTYHEDGLQRILTEKTSGGLLVSSHSLRYNPDGDRSQDVEKILQANSSEYLDQASTYAYTPARQLAAVVKTGVDKGDSESYDYDAAGNTTKQTIGATTSTMTYDRNRLTKTVTGGTTLNQRYDPFGRSTTTDVGAQVVEQNAYDGYDRLTRQQKFDTTGNPTYTRNQTYDPFDRMVNQSEKVGTAASITTRYTFVGLANQVTAEEEKDTTGTWKTSKAYAYGTAGENLSLVDTPVNTTTTKKSYYGTNPHGDVETLTDASTGATTSTYRYTAYGQPDKTGTTGDDAITGIASQDADIVNPYRFNSARFDGATGTYDMGFREYNPGLNRFLTRDLYNGALTDLALGSDPWNTNRYMFGGGNPISRIELNGHYAIEQDSDRFERHDTPTITAPGTTSSTGSTGGSTTPVPNNVGQEINQSMGLPAGASQQQQAIRMAALRINPTIAGFKLGAEEADRAGVDEAIDLFADVSGTTDAADCGYQHDARACGMTGLMLFPFGKLGKLARALVALKHADEAAKAAAELPKANATVKDLLKLVPGNAREADKAAMASGRTDQQLLESVFRPSDGQRMALYPDGRTLAQGNHRLYELLDRARDPFSSINWDTPIFIQGWKP